MAREWRLGPLHERFQRREVIDLLTRAQLDTLRRVQGDVQALCQNVELVQQIAGAQRRHSDVSLGEYRRLVEAGAQEVRATLAQAVVAK